MQVKAISYTTPCEALKSQGVNSTEDIIVYCARVSNPDNQLNVETGDKLLNYCIKHEHWSIFEHASMTVEIKTSRAIAAQILRHRSFTFQEFSQRYSPAQTIEPFELRKQATKNRQSSSDIMQENENGVFEVAQRAIEAAQYAYNTLLERGVARECARMFLPLTTQTTMYMTGTCRSFIHYINLRTKEDTQKEHRLIAEEVKYIFSTVFPLTSKALGYN